MANGDQMFDQPIGPPAPPLAPGGMGPGPGMGPALGLLPLLGLLGAGGIQNLSGQVPTTSQTRGTTSGTGAQTQQRSDTATHTPAYAAALANPFLAMLGGLQPGAMGMFNAAQGMLGGMAQGQIPSSISQLARNITNPLYANAYQRATEQGRQQGFYDAPATSPPGGAILAPLLSNAAGQEASLTNNMIQNLLPLLMNPAQNILNSAVIGMRAAPGLGHTTTGTSNLTGATSQMGNQMGSATGAQPSILNTMGQLSPWLSGLAGALGQGPMQQSFGSLFGGLRGLFGGGGGGAPSSPPSSPMTSGGGPWNDFGPWGGGSDFGGDYFGGGSDPLSFLGGQFA